MDEKQTQAPENNQNHQPQTDVVQPQPPQQPQQQPPQQPPAQQPKKEPSSSKDGRGKREKPKKSALRKLLVPCCCLLIIAALLGLFLDFGGFGSGLGFPTLQDLQNSAGDPARAPDSQADAPEPIEPIDPIEPAPPDTPDDTPQDPPGSPPLILRVVEDEIFFAGDLVPMDELVYLVQMYHQVGGIWQLHSERALLATIEQVRVLLNEAGVDFVDIAQ